MAFIYTYTTILNNGNWGSITKPILCEYPKWSDAEVKGAYPKRLVRVDGNNRVMKEIGQNFGAEAMESSDVFELLLKFASNSDRDEVAEQIRDIHAAYNTVVDKSALKYSHILILGDVATPSEKVNFMANFAVQCMRSGKVRGT